MLRIHFCYDTWNHTGGESGFRCFQLSSETSSHSEIDVLDALMFLVDGIVEECLRTRKCMKSETVTMPTTLSSSSTITSLLTSAFTSLSKMVRTDSEPEIWKLHHLKKIKKKLHHPDTIVRL